MQSLAFLTPGFWTFQWKRHDGVSEGGRGKGLEIWSPGSSFIEALFEQWWNKSIWCCSVTKSDFSGGASGKEPVCLCRSRNRRGFDPCVGKIPWRWAWQRTPVLLHGESHGQRRLSAIGSQRVGHNWSDLAHMHSYEVVSDSPQPHGLQHARRLSPPLSPGVCSDTCPWSQWCYLTICLSC